MRAFGVALLLAACEGGDKDAGPPPAGTDFDEDGHTAAVDCDDANATVHPGAQDLPYDGVDGDCAGDDDYDADGDGYASDDHGGDDCFDGSADISPGAPETPYDGVDNDCDPSSPDDDVDGDGFLALEDCDDGDGAVYPGALEVLLDGVDRDCDGLEDAGPFAFGDLLWTSPTRPRVAHTDHGFVIAAAAESLSSATWLPEANAHVAVALTVASDAGGLAPLAVPPLLWHGEYDDDEMGDVDLASTGAALVAGTTYTSATNRYGVLKLQPLTWVNGTGWYPGLPSYLDEPLADAGLVDVALDGAGVPWICASDADGLGYARGDTGGAVDGALVAGVDGGIGCFFEPGADAPMPFTSCAEDGCTTWRTDPDAADPTPVAAPSQPWAGERWDAVRERDGFVTVVVEGGGARLLEAGGLRTPLLDGLDVRDADALRAPDGAVWVVAVVNRGKGNEVLLTWGDPEGAMSEAWLPVVAAGRTFYPTGAALGLTDDRVLVAVSADEALGGDDAVGWLLLGRP